MLKKYYSSLIRRETGAAFIEFAIIAPFVILMIMGIIEFSLVMFGESVLEGALTSAAREGSTDYMSSTCPDGSTVQYRSAYINCLLQSKVAPLLNKSLLQFTTIDYPATGSSCTTQTSDGNTVTVTQTGTGGYGSMNSPPTFNTCSNDPNAKANSNPPSCASLQDAGCSGDVVVYQAQYPWSIVTPILRFALGDGNGVFTLRSSAVVKNEPFSPTGR